MVKKYVDSNGLVNNNGTFARNSTLGYVFAALRDPARRTAAAVTTATIATAATAEPIALCLTALGMLEFVCLIPQGPVP